MDNTIAMVEVKSSRLLALGYNSELFILRARFAGSGSEYDYFDVPPEIWNGVQKASSIGSYFGDHIAGKRGGPAPFPYAKTGSEKAVALWKEASGDAEPSLLQPSMPYEKPAQPVGEVLPKEVVIPQVELPTDQEGLTKRAVQVESESKALFLMRGTQPVLTLYTAEGYRQAKAIVVAKLQEKKRALEKVATIKDPATAAWKAACAFEKEVIQRYDAAINLLDRAANEWKSTQESAERAAAEAARKAEQKRLDAEAEERAAEARRQAAIDAENMRAVGQLELAKQIEEAPIAVYRETAAPVVQQTAVPRVDGERNIVTWKFQVDRPDEVSQFYAPNIAMACHSAGIGIPAGDKLKFFIQDIVRAFEFHSLDETKLGGRLRPMKEAGIGFIPGVRVWKEEKTSTTGR